MNPFFLFGALLLCAGIAYFLKTERSQRRFGILSAFGVCALSVLLAYPALQTPLSFGPEEMWHADFVGALLLVLSAVLFLFSSIVSYRYVASEFKRGILSFSDVRLYYCLSPIFLLSVFAAILANSLIVLWIAMECTTLTTAFLVGIYRRKSSLEAAWKYVLLCSMGIGLSLTGLVLTAFAFQAVGLSGGSTFLLSTLSSAAGEVSVNEALLKLAFVFVMVGFSTKMGLVPVHAWLPDALSKTPAPIAALLSSVLLPVSLFTLLRIKEVVDTALQGSDWTNRFFLVFGLLSIFLPALLLFIQRNYKRALAYASIVHMGVMVFAIGLGPAGIVPAFMHLPGFALLLSAGFLLSGEVILEAHTTDIEILKGLSRRMPLTSGLLFSVLLLLLILPPAGIFMSEILMTGYGLKEHPILTLVALLGMVLFSVALMRLAFTMFFSDDESDDLTTKEHAWTLTHAVAFIEIVFVVVLGILYLLPESTQFFVQIVNPLTFSL
jgi:hydrogenase-4 component F